MFLRLMRYYQEKLLSTMEQMFSSDTNLIHPYILVLDQQIDTHWGVDIAFRTG
jgi:hypothetical protein